MRIGELCAGYGGLGMGVKAVLGGEVAWYSEVDKGANKILAHRFPGVPNLGDMTTVDWAEVEPVDILTAGFPCQPVSHAGKRLGDLDERWLWDDAARAVRSLRPGLVVLENVRGLLTAGGGRLFGRVLGSLADLGYDAHWHGLRAADVGAPHGRWRIFIVAHPRRVGGTEGGRLADGQLPDLYGTPAVPEQRGGRALLPTPTSSDTNGAGSHEDGGLDLRTAVSLMPTPRATDGTKGGPNQRGSSGDLLATERKVTLLPTPAVNDMGAAYTPDQWDEWTEAMKAKHGNGNGHGKSLNVEAQRLLPTPEASRAGGTAEQHMARKRAADGRKNASVSNLDIVASDHGTNWGQYAAAISRWESLTRPAPAPTETGPKGNPRLSPAFSEWLMGLPTGWVTDVPGITRNEALKAIGNGVVPQQAAAALRLMLSTEVAA